MTGSRQSSSAGGSNSVAPFKERLSSGGQHTATKSASGSQEALTATSAPKQQRISQPVAAAHHHSRDRIKQALQPISAVRAVAKVAAAEAAVSAAAAALVPSKAPEPEPALQSSGPGHKAQPHPQQPKSRPRTHTLNASTPGAAGALQIAGTHAGPCRSSSMRRATAEVAAGCASSTSGSMQASVRASLTGTLQATHPNSAATQAPAQGPAPDEEVALLPLIYPAGSAGLQQPSAAAQLAAYGLTKRIRAQLRSAHGPPAFQRSAPPPRPASPPPVVLDGGMLLDCNPDACSPAAVIMADLSSRNISCTSPQPASQASAAAASAAYFNQQLSLQSFSSLVSLDLSDNRLECFAGLAVLPSLQQLNLAANRLRSLQGLQPAPAAATEVSTLIKEGRQRAVSSGGIRGSDGGGCGEGGDGSGVACRQQDHEGSSSGLGEGGGDGAVDTAADAAIQPADSCGTGSINEAQPAGLPCEPSQQQQQQEETVQHADEQVVEAHSDMHQQQQPQQPQDQDSGVDSLQEHLGQNHDAGSTVGPGSSPLQCALPALMGFALLEVLDVSYNMLSGEALLGLASPLGLLPRLCELHAAGNGIGTLPEQLAPFATLSLLRLPHNQLHMAAVASLGQLPALQLLDLSHNPLTSPAQGTQYPDAVHHGFANGDGCLDRSPAAAEGQDGVSAVAQARGRSSFPELRVLDLSSSRVRQLQVLQELLGCMQGLAELWLANTPLAESCRTGKVQEQDLHRPGLTVVLSSGSNSQVIQQQQQQPGKQHLIAPGPLLRIPDAATPSKVLAAASKAALVALPHEQLVAAFDRVTAGIDSWQQLAPVLEEEGSWDWQGEGSGQQASGGMQAGQQALGPGKQLAAADEEPVEDRTFLTGVGITGELPDDGVDAAASTHGSCSDQQVSSWQDPTERLALALGLQVSQLAHMTGIVPGNPDGALHRLRHALAHPLVDPDAGQRPQQHHMRSTAATTAKQQPGRSAPLPQPISATLSTRVQPVQDLGVLLKDMRSRLDAMQSTLLPQLQAQATKLAPGAAS